MGVAFFTQNSVFVKGHNIAEQQTVSWMQILARRRDNFSPVVQQFLEVVEAIAPDVERVPVA